MVTHDMRRILFTLTLAAMSAMMAIAQVTFKIEAPRQTEVGQQIRVKYVANTTDVEDIHVGDFPGFEVVYGPSTSRSNSFTMVNGKTSRSSTMTFTYVLVATKEGTHKLPAGTIKVDGKAKQPVKQRRCFQPAAQHTENIVGKSRCKAREP